MFWAAMPETAIDEHRHPGLWEDEIRPSKNRLMPPPPGEAMPPKEFYRRQFSGFVATSANARHEFGAFQFCENVSHSQWKHASKDWRGKPSEIRSNLPPHSCDRFRQQTNVTA